MKIILFPLFLLLSACSHTTHDTVAEATHSKPISDLNWVKLPQSGHGSKGYLGNNRIALKLTSRSPDYTFEITNNSGELFRTSSLFIPKTDRDLQEDFEPMDTRIKVYKNGHWITLLNGRNVVPGFRYYIRPGVTRTFKLSVELIESVGVKPGDLIKVGMNDLYSKSFVYYR